MIHNDGDGGPGSSHFRTCIQTHLNISERTDVTRQKPSLDLKVCCFTPLRSSARSENFCQTIFPKTMELANRLKPSQSDGGSRGLNKCNTFEQGHIHICTAHLLHWLPERARWQTWHLWIYLGKAPQCGPWLTATSWLMGTIWRRLSLAAAAPAAAASINWKVGARCEKLTALQKTRPLFLFPWTRRSPPLHLLVVS